jgi:hypothetical protein
MIALILPVATTFGLFFHKFWEGVLLCLTVCIAKGSEVSRSRRHTCICGPWVSQILCDILLPVRSWDNVLEGQINKQASEIFRVFCWVVSKHIERLEVGSGGLPFSLLAQNLHGVEWYGSSSLFSSLGGKGLDLGYCCRGCVFVSSEHGGTS